MKKIITTVGTSFITNYEKDQGELEEKHYLESPISNSDNDSNIDCIRKLVNWSSKQNKENVSAEISSILKIQKEINEDIKVYLITSDSIASLICAKSVKEYLENLKDVKMDITIESIDSLQVDNRKKFISEGLPNLISIIDGIANGFYGNMVFNVTGGYKGVIPFLTILASINQCEIKYIFENSKELITIPLLPIRIDYDLFEQYFKELIALSEGIENYSKIRNQSYLKYQLLEQKGMIEKFDEYAMLSPIGQIFFSKYQNKFISFYASDEVYETILCQKDILRILKEKFFTGIRKSKLEQKGIHLVFDDGDNNNRIYYFENDGLIYIYKTFQNEKKAIAFIKTKLNKEKIIEQAKLRKIEI